MTIPAQIEAALFDRVASLVLSPALPVAWPNMSFAPVLTGYLAVTHLPTINRRRLIGSGEPHQRLGLLQVSVFAQINKGSSAATEIAGKIAEHFPADLSMINDGLAVRVTQTADVMQALRNDPFWHVPVRISYECWA